VGSGEHYSEQRKAVLPVQTFARKLESSRHNPHAHSPALATRLSTSPELNGECVKVDVEVAVGFRDHHWRVHKTEN